MLVTILAAVISGIIGFTGAALLAVFGQWDHLSYRRVAKKRLREALLDTRFEWRKFETLCRIAGSEDREQVRNWLVSLGARQSGDGRDIWTLQRKEELILSEDQRVEPTEGEADGLVLPVRTSDACRDSAAH